jgi:hypothetical protein
LEALGSPAREAVALLVSVVAADGAVTVMLMVAVVFAAIADVMEQEIVVVPEQDQPADAVTETNVTLAGNVSVRTPTVTGAAAWPRFFTWMVYTRFEKMKTGVGETVMETARSAAGVGSTMIDVTLVLLAGAGSTVPEVTVAEF